MLESENDAEETPMPDTKNRQPMAIGLILVGGLDKLQQGLTDAAELATGCQNTIWEDGMEEGSLLSIEVRLAQLDSSELQRVAEENEISVGQAHQKVLTDRFDGGHGTPRFVEGRSVKEAAEDQAAEETPNA
jgi:hypothetical protein